MAIVLRQRFPLGRFHATAWRANRFDDAIGEWPPSPWRLVRALLARGHQAIREPGSTVGEADLDAMVAALCDSDYAFHLPGGAQRGPSIRQYRPAAGIDWVPPGAAQPRMRAHPRLLAQDQSWSVPIGAYLYWHIHGECFTPAILSTLDRCLERVVYFGRAESYTEIERIAPASAPAPNCVLDETPARDRVPVLVPDRAATRADLERTTADDDTRTRTVPLGGRYMYTARPAPTSVSATAAVRRHARGTNLIQFAIGAAVWPDTGAITRLTSRFRSRVVRAWLDAHAGAGTTWLRAPGAARDAVAGLLGKDADGQPLRGRRHASYLIWFDRDRPARLVVWRPEPFEAAEHDAILTAAARPLGWEALDADRSGWQVTLIPLDASVPSPPGFGGRPHGRWQTVTPYVPPRHRFRAGGRERPAESIEAQVTRELALRGFPAPEEVEVARGSRWVSVYVPRGTRRSPVIGQRRGFDVGIRFADPQTGPIALGQSATLGLGLFGPVLED